MREGDWRFSQPQPMIHYHGGRHSTWQVGDTVYFTYDPLYPEDPPYALEEVCHVTAVSGVTVSFDNTQPHGGQTVCRSYTPGPFKIEAAKNDTLAFHIDGIEISLTLAPGDTVSADDVAGQIGAAIAAAGAEAVADTIDGCVRISSTKPIGTSEIIPWGGTAESTIGIPPGVYAGSGPQYHVHKLASAADAVKDIADTINGGGKNVYVVGPDQSSVIEATASGNTLTIAFKTSPPPAQVMGKLGSGEIITVRSFHEGEGTQGVTFGANRSLRFTGGDNDTKYRISLPLGFLTDKNGGVFSAADCRKMYMVFAPRFEIVEESLMLAVMEAVAAALTTTTEPLELIEYIDARRVEELAAGILGKRVPIAILLLYTVLTPRGLRDRGTFHVGFTLRVLQEYFLARHLHRKQNINSQYPASVQALLTELRAKQQDRS